ncbi:hypothetical protein ASE93_23440 [Serratia sp. Leaf50]|nr:hypothetical protein ASE93_23440 [Serratia sp. Leaf50]
MPCFFEFFRRLSGKGRAWHKGHGKEESAAVLARTRQARNIPAPVTERRNGVNTWQRTGAHPTRQSLGVLGGRFTGQ